MEQQYFTPRELADNYQSITLQSDWLRLAKLVDSKRYREGRRNRHRIKEKSLHLKD